MPHAITPEFQEISSYRYFMSGDRLRSTYPVLGTYTTHVLHKQEANHLKQAFLGV